MEATREQRRKQARDRAQYSDELAQVPKDLWPAVLPGYPEPRAVWLSKEFLVQAYAEENPLVLARLSVVRVMHDGTDWIDGITWDQLQGIKNFCGYAFHDAVEVYPDARHVVNVANMRHLWVLHAPIPFKWSNG